SWRSGGGYVLAAHGRREAVTPRDATRFSPKFSLGFMPADDWTLRYSLARAWRFPIVEELFSQYEAYNSVNHANPALAPENGLHHNLAVQRFLPNGELTLNLYHETVRDVIEAQSASLPGGVSLRTFLPVDEVKTSGVELTANLNGFLLDALDLRLNLAWTDSRITRNAVDPALEGKDFPRMPRWRANALLNYHLSDTLSFGSGLRYASRGYGRLDNLDTA